MYFLLPGSTLGCFSRTVCLFGEQFSWCLLDLIMTKFSPLFWPTIFLFLLLYLLNVKRNTLHLVYSSVKQKNGKAIFACFGDINCNSGGFSGDLKCQKDMKIYYIRRLFVACSRPFGSTINESR